MAHDLLIIICLKIQVMEDLTRRTSFKVSRKLLQEEIHKCTSILKPLEGITDLEIMNQMISVTYNPYLISDKEIARLLDNLKIEILPTAAKCGIIKSWIDKLGRNNKKVYGNQHLDCCGLNRKQN